MRYRFAALSACLAVMASAGVAMAQPANGVCSLALPAQWVFPGSGGFINQTAAQLTGWSYSGAACAGTSGGVVYYNFTPATAGPWRLSTCASTPTWDTVLSIHTGCPANATNYATGAAATSCNDTGTGCTNDASTFDTTALTPGVTYVIRLAQWNSLTVPAGGVRVDVTNLNVPTSCCNGLTGACTVATSASSCPAGTTALATANGVCSPNPCPQPPANDLCTAATVIPATALPFNFNVTGNLAAAQPTTALAPAVCALSSRDVFYAFTPVASGAYTITTCNAITGGLDTVLSVHTGCPGDGSTLIAGLCSDDNCTGGVGASTISAAALTGGTPYIIRVARYGTNNPGGPFRLDISTGAFGACCDVAAGTCQLQSQSACASPRIFQGDATTCSPNPCLGTCCNPSTGACTLTGSTACVSPNVFTAGPGAVCSPNPCPQPPAPANDTCAAAQVVTAGTPAASGVTTSANTDADEVHTCVTGTTNGVWYAFTSAANASFQIDTLGGPLDTVLSVFDGCGGAELACDDDAPTVFAGASQVQLTLNAAQSVRILVSNYSTFTTPGAFVLNITSINLGSCCNAASGACTVSTTGAAGCASGTTFTNGATCTPNVCPQPPAPANDECTAATVVTIGTPASGQITGATGADITTCSGSDIDVWFVFTPAASGLYAVTATPTLATDAALALAAFDTCPATPDANQP
ncbi:MAG: hypothetical protein K2Q20_04330, partial [Phycisphaerales bacterium]|nr:hypothetical protein [Phycisphaerales bacterium]